MLDEAHRQALYEQLCESARRERHDPGRVDAAYLEQTGVLPLSDGRSKPTEFEHYEKRYSGAVLRDHVEDASLGSLAVQLVRTGYSGVVAHPRDYERYAELCRRGWAKWRSRADGVEFFPSAKALALMERGDNADGSLDGLGAVPPWHRAPRPALTQTTIARGTWFLAVVATLWSTMIVGALIIYRTDADSNERLVALLLLAITVGGGVLVYAYLRPEVRAFVEDRLLSTANVAVIVSALVVPIAASFFLRDYRQTQIQADLTKALMEHMGKTGDEGELSASQLALMIDLLDKNKDKFGLELDGFRMRLEQLDEARRLAEKQRRDDDAARRAREQERSFHDIQAALEATRTEKEASNREKERLEQEKTALDGRIDRLNQEYAAAKAKADERGKDAKQAKKRLEQLARDRKELQADRAHREERLVELVKKSEQLAVRARETESALGQEVERAREIESARQQLVEKAAEDSKSLVVLSDDLAKVTKALGEAQGREGELRKQIEELLKSRSVLEQEVRQTVLYYGNRADQYSRPDGERPSFETLARLTATKALQALEALEGSGVALSQGEKELRSKLEGLLEQAPQVKETRTTAPAGGESERTEGRP
jgi:hypothetical protein